MDEIAKVKTKKEFSELPDSFVEKVLEMNGWDVKSSRAFLRKYVSVFLTNKVFKLQDEKILKKHMSSTNRNYSTFYKKIIGDEKFTSVVDFGAGVNGFSYGYLAELLGAVDYVGVEVVGQLVDKTNQFFKERGFEKAKCLHLDLFELENVVDVVKNTQKRRLILMLQVVDALESVVRDYSKDLLLRIKEVMGERDLIILTMSGKSLSGKNKFQAKRTWLKTFAEENFQVEEDYIGHERIFKLRK